MGKFCCSIFKSSLFWMIMTALLCLSLHIGINISFVYLWLFLIDELLLFSLITESYLFLKYFIIPILFFYNYFIIRKIVISWLFEWQFPFQIFSIYKERQTYLTFLKLRFRSFIRVIELLLRSNHKISKRETDDIESFLSLFGEELNIYDQLYHCVNNNNTKRNLVKYKMSKCQIKYYNLLKSIDNILNENNTKNVFLNLKQNINNIVNTNSLFNDQNNLIQLNTLLKECLTIISKYDWNNYTYMSPLYLYNLLFNDTFGSLSLYSIQFKNKIKEYHFEQNFTPKGKVHYTLIINKESSINDSAQIEDSLISEDNKKSDDGTLFLFCLPNG